MRQNLMDYSFTRLVMKNNKVIGDTPSCGCCSNDYEMTIHEAIEHIDSEIAELSELKTKLQKRSAL